MKMIIILDEKRKALNHDRVVVSFMLAVISSPQVRILRNVIRRTRGERREERGEGRGRDFESLESFEGEGEGEEEEDEVYLCILAE